MTEFKNSATSYFAGKFNTNQTSANNNERDESLNITRNEFENYTRIVFRKLDTMIGILETLARGKEAAKRATIEQDIESTGQQIAQGNSERQRSSPTVNSSLALAASAAVGFLVGKFNEFVEWATNFGERVRQAFNDVRNWVEDAISNIVGAAGGAVRGAIDAAPAILENPIEGVPAVIEGAARGAARGYEDAQEAQRRRDSTVSATSFPTTPSAVPPPIAPTPVPTGRSHSLATGGPERTSGVRDNPNPNAMQNRMAQFAGARGWTVTSSYRPGDGSSDHNVGNAIDIRSRGTDITDDVLRDVFLQFKRAFPGQNFQVIYEPHARGGAHIHIETGHRADNTVGIANSRGHIVRRIAIEGMPEARPQPSRSVVSPLASAAPTATPVSNNWANELFADPNVATPSVTVIPGTVERNNTSQMIDETRPTQTPRQVPLSARDPFASAALRFAFGT